jgi:hypothetical protein
MMIVILLTLLKKKDSLEITNLFYQTIKENLNFSMLKVKELHSGVH